jgi:hypothetical protein
VHFIVHPFDTPETKQEYARIRVAVERHFQLSPAPGNQPPTGGERWQRATVAPRPPG